MKNLDLVDRIASERIRRLVSMAEARTKEKNADSRKLAKRYASLAKRISAHYKTEIPRDLKAKICKNCGNILVPGINCSVRLASSRGYVVYVCECGEEKHIFYKKRR